MAAGAAFSGAPSNDFDVLARAVAEGTEKLAGAASTHADSVANSLASSQPDVNARALAKRSVQTQCVLEGVHAAGAVLMHRQLGEAGAAACRMRESRQLISALWTAASFLAPAYSMTGSAAPADIGSTPRSGEPAGSDSRTSSGSTSVVSQHAARSALIAAICDGEGPLDGDSRATACNPMAGGLREMHAASALPHWISAPGHRASAAQDPGGSVGVAFQLNELAFRKAASLGARLTAQALGALVVASGLPAAADAATSDAHEEIVPGLLQIVVAASSPESGSRPSTAQSRIAARTLVFPGCGPAGIAVAGSVIAVAMQLYAAASGLAHKGGIAGLDRVSLRTAQHARQALEALAAPELLNALDRETCGSAVQPIHGAIKHLLGSSPDDSSDASSSGSYHRRGRAGAGAASGPLLSRSMAGPHPAEKPLLVWNTSKGALVPASAIFTALAVPSLGARLGREASHRPGETVSVLRAALLGPDGGNTTPGHPASGELVSEAGMESTRRASVGGRQLTGGSTLLAASSGSGSASLGDAEAGSVDRRPAGVRVRATAAASAGEALQAASACSSAADGSVASGLVLQAEIAVLGGGNRQWHLGNRVAGQFQSPSRSTLGLAQGVRQSAAGIRTAAGALRAGERMFWQVASREHHGTDTAALEHADRFARDDRS